MSFELAVVSMARPLFRVAQRFIFRIGINAQLKYEQKFQNTLLRLPLSPLTFGPVIIGPYASVGSTVELAAQANGKLLAGAEMSLQNAHVLIDIIQPTNSKKDGWQPSFKPVFTADGEIELSASLGLPFGLHCGITIFSFKKSVAFIDEPSIKGQAKIAAEAGLDSQGSIQGGIKDQDGCKGIRTELSWWNKLYVDVLGLKQLSIFDSNDVSLAKGCIKPPGGQNSNSTTRKGPEGGSNPVTSSDPVTTSSPVTSSNPSTSSGPEASSNPDTDSMPGTSPNTTDNSGAGSGPEAGDSSSMELPRSVESRLRPRDVIDATHTVNGSDELSYDPIPLRTFPYNNTQGYEYNLLTVSDASLVVVSCGDGSIYFVKAEAADSDIGCTPMWATYSDVLVANGAQRIAYYYSNTMDVVGVSRVRMSDMERIPNNGIPIVFAPYPSDPDDDNVDDGFFVAFDWDEFVLYPVACTYTGDRAPKMFVVADPGEGIKMLQSPDVEYSITGGPVAECLVMPLLMGTYSDEDEGYDYCDDVPDDYSLDVDYS
ncbi:hypothetical protein GGR58DRAFT_473565 [Xylaria digitata]|nr:hypothetical protein GGR58DRAFT_473565 [Xylaria digitata]